MTALYHFTADPARPAAGSYSRPPNGYRAPATREKPLRRSSWFAATAIALAAAPLVRGAPTAFDPARLSRHVADHRLRRLRRPRSGHPRRDQDGRLYRRPVPRGRARAGRRPGRRQAAVDAGRALAQVRHRRHAAAHPRPRQRPAPRPGAGRPHHRSLADQRPVRRQPRQRPARLRRLWGERARAQLGRFQGRSTSKASCWSS